MRLQEKDLVARARDATATYQNMLGLYLKSKIRWEELRLYRAQAERAECAMRSAIKKGGYGEIRKDLAKKFKR